MTGFSSPDLAIDLGTATTRIAGGRHGVDQQPSVSRSVRALDRGVIVDRRAATEVLRPMIRERWRSRFARPRVLACAPTDVSWLERDDVKTCILEAGASSVVVVPEPLAAAVGSGIDIGCKYAKLLVDFGEGVTDCALIRDGRIEVSLAERVGCSDLRATVRSYVQRETGVEFTEAAADILLRRVGVGASRVAVYHLFGPARREVLPVSVADLYAELHPVVERMLAPLTGLLRDIPAAIGAEIIEDGIFLTGGGALLPGLCEAVAASSAIETRVVRDPLRAVICGAWTMLPMAHTLKLWRA